MTHGTPPIELNDEQLQAAEDLWEYMTSWPGGSDTNSGESLQKAVEALAILGIARQHGAQIGALNDKLMQAFQTLGWEGMQYLAYRYYMEGWGRTGPLSQEVRDRLTGK